MNKSREAKKAREEKLVVEVNALQVQVIQMIFIFRGIQIIRSSTSAPDYFYFVAGLDDLLVLFCSIEKAPGTGDPDHLGFCS